MIHRGQVDPDLWVAIRRERLDTFEGAFAYAGGEDLDKPGLGARRRTCLHLTDTTGRTHKLYLKRYGPDRQRGRPLSRRPHQSVAAIEFANIGVARSAGIATMQGLLWAAESGISTSAGRSYLLVTAVPGEALERCGESFLARHVDDDKAAELTASLAELVRRLHLAGHVHRDLYASHVFLDESAGDVSLYLIDLARMFAPRWRKFRWRVKDLAQLKYSMPAAWVSRYWGDFLHCYLGGRAVRARNRYNAAVDRKVAAMRAREAHKTRAAAPKAKEA